MKKKKKKKKALGPTLFLATAAALGLLWSCSNAPPYGGGGRDLGPQMANMGAAEGGADGSDSGVKIDTGVDTGVTDTGVGN